MSLRNIGIVYKKELTEALRDRRTLISTIVVPLLMFPLLTVGFGAAMVSLMNKAERETPKVIILGAADSPHVLADLKNWRAFNLWTLPLTGRIGSSTKRLGLQWKSRRVSKPTWFGRNRAP